MVATGANRIPDFAVSHDPQMEIEHVSHPRIVSGEMLE